MLTPLAPVMTWLTASFRALLGICEAPFYPAVTAGVSKYVPEQTKRGTFMSFCQSGSELGPAIGTSVSALLLKAWGVPSIFIVFGGFGIALSLIWVVYSANRTEQVTVSSADTTELIERSKEQEYPLRKLLSSGTVWSIILAYFSVPFCNFLFLAWLPIYLSKYRHYHVVMAGYLTALPFLAGFVAYLFSGYVSDKIAKQAWAKNGLNRKLLIYIGALFYIIALPVAGFTTSNTVSVEMLILANIGLAFYSIQFWVLVSDITPRQAGTISGFMNFVGILGGTLAPFITGLLVSATGSFVTPFIIAVCIVIVATLAVAFFVRVKPLSQLMEKA
jgi:sugar phosphate permease